MNENFDKLIKLIDDCKKYGSVDIRVVYLKSQYNIYIKHGEERECYNINSSMIKKFILQAEKFLVSLNLMFVG